MPKQTSPNSTQRFTEIKDISGEIVVFAGNNACLIIEIAAINFSLLSKDEQDARVSAYSSFLNSLSFPVQILAINKRVDISAYIKLLDEQIKSMIDPKVASYMNQYRQFIEALVKQNVVLDKRFYAVIHYSNLEQGAVKVASTGSSSSDKDFINEATVALRAKAEGIRAQLERMNLPTKILEQDQILELFANLYGQTIKEGGNPLKEI